MEMSVWVGNLESQDRSEREAYRDARVEVSDLGYFVMEQPDTNYPFRQTGQITVDLSEMPENHSLPAPVDGESAARFFVSEWNAFIFLSAGKATISWLGERYEHE